MLLHRLLLHDVQRPGGEVGPEVPVEVHHVGGQVVPARPLQQGDALRWPDGSSIHAGGTGGTGGGSLCALCESRSPGQQRCAQDGSQESQWAHVLGPVRDKFLQRDIRGVLYTLSHPTPLLC